MNICGSILLGEKKCFLNGLATLNNWGVKKCIWFLKHPTCLRIYKSPKAAGGNCRREECCKGPVPGIEIAYQCNVLYRFAPYLRCSALIPLESRYRPISEYLLRSWNRTRIMDVLNHFHHCDHDFVYPVRVILHTLHAGCWRRMLKTNPRPHRKEIVHQRMERERERMVSQRLPSQKKATRPKSQRCHVRRKPVDELKRPKTLDMPVLVRVGSAAADLPEHGSGSTWVYARWVGR